MIDRLKTLLDTVDPAPPVIAEPVEAGDRLTAEEGVSLRDSGTSLTFRRRNIVVHLDLGDELTGMVLPAGSEVLVRWPEGVIRPVVDEHGLFIAPGLPHGPVQITAGRAVTDWFVW